MRQIHTRSEGNIRRPSLWLASRAGLRACTADFLDGFDVVPLKIWKLFFAHFFARVVPEVPNLARF
jgi:hypothetical protein